MGGCGMSRAFRPLGIGCGGIGVEEGGGAFGGGELVEEVEAHVVCGEAVVGEGEGSGGAVDEDDEGSSLEDFGVDGFEVVVEGGGEEGMVGVVGVFETGEIGPTVVSGFEGFWGVELFIDRDDIVRFVLVADLGAFDPKVLFGVHVAGREELFEKVVGSCGSGDFIELGAVLTGVEAIVVRGEDVHDEFGGSAVGGGFSDECPAQLF